MNAPTGRNAFDAAAELPNDHTATIYSFPNKDGQQQPTENASGVPVIQEQKSIRAAQAAENDRRGIENMFHKTFICAPKGVTYAPYPDFFKK